MCRALVYLGTAISIENLLYHTDNSLIKQSYDPKYMVLKDYNLAGFGMAAWDKTSFFPEKPFVYKTALLPFYDANLKALASKLNSHCFLAHIRGVQYKEFEVVIPQNAHPFLFNSSKIVLAHNGNLVHFGDIKPALCQRIAGELFKNIQGNTDSEWIYALLLTILRREYSDESMEAVKGAVTETFRQIKEIYQQHKIPGLSPVNLFITDGDFVVSTRATIGAQQVDKKLLKSFIDSRTLWYTLGESYNNLHGQYQMTGNKNNAIIIASEPLTQSQTTWKEVPEYSMLTARKEKEEIKFSVEELVL